MFVVVAAWKRSQSHESRSLNSRESFFLSFFWCTRMFDPASMMITQTMKNVCEALAPHHRCNRHIHSKSVTPSPSSPKPPPPTNTHTHTYIECRRRVRQQLGDGWKWDENEPPNQWIRGNGKWEREYERYGTITWRWGSSWKNKWTEGNRKTLVCCCYSSIQFSRQ